MLAAFYTTVLSPAKFMQISPLMYEKWRHYHYTTTMVPYKISCIILINLLIPCWCIEAQWLHSFKNVGWKKCEYSTVRIRSVHHCKPLRFLYFWRGPKHKQTFWGWNNILRISFRPCSPPWIKLNSSKVPEESSCGCNADQYNRAAFNWPERQNPGKEGLRSTHSWRWLL